jgi:hypothetical protein
MRKSSKLLFAGLTAALVLSLAASGVGARSFRTDEQRFNAHWEALRFIAGGRTISCRVTLEGSFHEATIAKVEEALVGYVSRASVSGERCTGGSATVLTATLPWHIRYGGFEGILPEIEGIRVRLIGASFEVRPTGQNFGCLASTTTTNPARGIINIANRRVISLTAEVGAEIPLRGGGGLCAFAGRGHFEGTTTALERLAGGSITVSLI